LDYVPVGPRFSNTILQTIQVCFKQIPPNNRSILVLSTTSHRQLLDELDIADCFTTEVHDPQINSLDYVLIVLKEVKLFSESDQYQRVDAGLPALLNPNKDSSHCNKNVYFKWHKNALDVLLVEVMDHVPTEDVFDKLSNPLLNGLKNFSSSNEVFCQKCSKLTRVSKNGKTKDTYQFSCNGGEKMHYISATQILETIPDEWIADLVEIFDNPYRAQILDWINKEHLSPEI
jgi:hypothetical protein